MPTSTDDAEAQRADAIDRLWAWKDQKLTLNRPLVFVPGLSDEAGTCWEGFEQVLPEVLTNFGTHVHVLQFTGVSGTGYPPYDDFIGFGGDVARYVQDDPSLAAHEVDFVCHSMGGLDTLAALALLSRAPGADGLVVPNAHNVVTFDTPFCGFKAADNGLFKAMVKRRRTNPADSEHLLSQLAALRPEATQIVLTWEARNRFLQALDAFWPFGADNVEGLLEVPDNSASFGHSWDFDPGVRKRYNEYRPLSDTSHSGDNGVTNDPRAMVEVLGLVTRA